MLSYYLTDKAYDFYTQKVANDEANWTLGNFYDELFKYCFPVDYRMQLRRTLTQCHQNEKTVAEYTHELNELFNMIGDVPERDQVLKFWDGSRPVIQKGLWRDNLNPETSSWARVVAQAEIIEILENLAERRDRARAGPSSHRPNAPSGSSTGANQSKGRSLENSVRSVSYESKTGTHNRSSSRYGCHKSNTPDNRTISSGARERSHPFRGRPAYQGRSQTPRSTTTNHQHVPRLSDKEKAERLAAGQCFLCGGTDHFSRNCPTKGTVKSTDGKPPGTASFNIEPTVYENSSDGVEVLDSLPIGALFIEPEDEAAELTDSDLLDDVTDLERCPISEWRNHYPYWGQPGIQARCAMGDSYAIVTNAVLTLGQPYPGDELYHLIEMRPEDRFLVRKRGSEYKIYDSSKRRGSSGSRIA